MRWFRFFGPLLLASEVILSTAAAGVAAINPEGGSGSSAQPKLTVPPVLRTFEAADSGHLVLPGPPPPRASALQKFQAVPPVATTAKLPTALVENPNLGQPLPTIAPAEPATPIKPAMAPALEREIARYCQKQIGHWNMADARSALGRAKRQRPAYDERNAVNGTIYAFADPTGRYQDLELDFDRETGILRSVFVYPPRLTWQECRRLWAGPVNSADAGQGRKFYSHTSRRLDVLVDAEGKVVSLGWY